MPSSSLGLFTVGGRFMPQVVDTRELAAAERFSFWQDMVSQVAMPVEVRSSYAADFRATVRWAISCNARA